jgi:hypothetical protein
MKSGNLNFLEPSGPLQACNGTALPLSVLLKEEEEEQQQQQQGFFDTFSPAPEAVPNNEGSGCGLRRALCQSSF